MERKHTILLTLFVSLLDVLGIEFCGTNRRMENEIRGEYEMILLKLKNAKHKCSECVCVCVWRMEISVLVSQMVIRCSDDAAHGDHRIVSFIMRDLLFRS